MALLRKLLYKKPPNGLVDVSERIYVFDSCFRTKTWEQEEYKAYVGNIISKFQETYPESSVMIFNFREGDIASKIHTFLSPYFITIMDYPRDYEGCPVLTIEVIHHFLKSSESWLSLGQHNIVLMHCEVGGWPVLAFMLAALLLHRKHYTAANRALEMVYKRAPPDVSVSPQLMSPLNSLASQLRYLQYVLKKNNDDEQWPPAAKALKLDCVMMRMIPDFDGKGGCCPIFRIYGQNPSLQFDKSSKLLFSTPRRSTNVQSYNQAESEVVKIDINCHIQGDIVLECLNLHDDMAEEDIMYKAMFNTAFIKSNTLVLNHDEIDVSWDIKDQFSTDFEAEFFLSESNTKASIVRVDLSSFEEEGLPIEAFGKVQEMFSSVDLSCTSAYGKIQLIDHQRAYNCEILLSKVKTPVPELMEHVLKLDESAMNVVDQVDNLIQCCPTREEMEIIKGYEGDPDKLGKCEQIFIELMRFPRSEAKLIVYSYKLQFSTQVTELRDKLSILYLSVEQLISSVKLRRVMQTIVSLGNAFNQGTATGDAVVFRLDSLLKLNQTRDRSNKTTLMHYLYKVLADKLPELVDFSRELGSLEAASKIQLKFLKEEMCAVTKGLEKVVQEKKLCKKDGHVSKKFRKSLKKFLASAEPEVRSLAMFYSRVVVNYFGEDPKKCPYEKVVGTLCSFVRMFNQAHDENCKQI
ncbi:unnamed protein product [Lactuca saligna]|uniref:Formin-like protein n=1 Tax=Lactuca saligna TaxID=75948 RepID=A0AA36EJH3_LACSI|nr:unnamed protein product [Lactuca saligna]